MKQKMILTPLEGKLVKLDLLEESHIPALKQVIQGCHYPLTTTPRTEEELVRYVKKAVELREAGTAIPFVTIEKRSGKVLGSTRLANIEWWDWGRDDAKRVEGSPDALEIGWTWLLPEAHGSGINAEAKLLQLTLAFETMKVKRVTLKTDERNTQSRNAIIRLGASLDGILRCHIPAADTGIRNTAIYSILASEWHEVRTRLVDRILRHQS